MSRERRPLVISELEQEIRVSQNQTDQFDEAACELLGINRTDCRCMDILDRGQRMTAGELAEESGLTTGAVTAVLDRMEHAGYVRRVRDMGDRRRVFCELTPLAHRLGEQIWGPLAEHFQTLIAEYSTEQLELIRDFLRRGRELNADQLARLNETTIDPRPASKEPEPA